MNTDKIDKFLHVLRTWLTGDKRYTCIDTLYTITK